MLPENTTKEHGKDVAEQCYFKKNYTRFFCFNMGFNTMKLVMIATLFVFSSLAAEQPWGKDADLVQKSALEKDMTTSLVSSGAEKLIRLYQIIVSPADGPRSHFRLAPPVSQA